VLGWPELLKHDAFAALRMIQSVQCANGETLLTTRCPVRIDGQLLNSPVGAPRTGEHTRQILNEFGGGEFGAGEFPGEQ
jgi:CoA:oxalate CoA-transferase